MVEVLLNSASYLVVIGIGFLIKRIGLLKAEAADVLMKLILNLTLPCLLINSSVGAELSADMVIFLVLGVAFNVIALLVIFLVQRRNSDNLLRGVSMLCSGGIDVGNFVLPFVQTFYPGLGVMILCIFNIGNTIMLSGPNYAVAGKVAARGEKFGVKEVLARLFSSVTFDVYLLILFMAVTKLPWPSFFLRITGIIGNANIFLVMMMLGLKLEFSLERSDMGNLVRILATRYGVGLAMAGLLFLLPVSNLARVVLCCALFGPTSALSSVFARQLGYKGAFASQMNVITIFLGMVIITGILMCAA